MSKSDWLMLFVGVGIIAVALWVFTSNNSSDNDTQGARPSASATPVPSFTLSSKDAAALNRSIKSFSENYFSLDLSKSPEEVKKDVSPYVTNEFLKRTQFGLGSSEADQAMMRENARIEATTVTELKPLPDMDSPLLDERTVQGIVTLRLIKYDRDGDVVTEGTRPQEITAVKQGAVWRIDQAPRT